MHFFKFARVMPPTPAPINRKTSDKRHGEGSVTPLLFFGSVSNGNVPSHISINPELQDRDWGSKVPPNNEKSWFLTT